MDKKEKWKSINNCVKDSFLELFSTYELTSLIFYSGLLFCGIFILDYYNVPTQIIQQIPVTIIWVVISVILVIFITWLIASHILDLFHIVSANFVDATSFTVATSLFSYSIVRLYILGQAPYTIVSSIACLISFSTLVIRLILRCYKLYYTNKKTSNLIDLKDLFENQFTYVQGKPILLSENDVDYDLLDRGAITNQLYRSIIHCQPNQSYVISLEGEWGSGKTTIINNTKRLLRENATADKGYIYIDDFDPWLYGTQEALLSAMLETIIDHLGMHYSPSHFDGTIKELCETVPINHWSGNFIKSIFSASVKPQSDVARLKQITSRYLRSVNKTVVFFIDNFDRTNEDNVIFLFKLIAKVFDLPGIIFVLSFEQERINAILEKTHHLDPRFKEKIIQQEIKVPAISEEKSQLLYFTCISNLLMAYGVTDDKIKDFAPVAKYIFEKTRTVRTFKRMVNSVFPIVFCDDTLLRKSDLLAIEAIHFYDPELFYTIYKSSRYFISHDKSLEDSLKVSFNKEAFNNDCKSFFENLFAKHEDAKELLSTLFPYVKRYKSKLIFESNSQFSDPETIEISKQARICSGKYFDLYFSYSTNNHIAILENIKSMISSINNTPNTSTDAELQKTINIVHAHLLALKNEDHKEWIEELQKNISDINTSNVFSVAVSLYRLIYHLDNNNSDYGFGLGSRSRAEYIISSLLEKCSESEFEKFLSIIKYDYRQIRVIHSLHYWMSSEELDHAVTYKTRVELLWDTFADMCNRIVEKNICLYHNDYYYSHNAWGLYQYYKHTENVSEFTAYIINNLSTDNIYRVLWDITSTSIGNQYRYSINEEYFNLFINNTDLVDKLLESSPPRSKDEEFVLQIYYAFRNGSPDIWVDKGITVPTYKELRL